MKKLICALMILMILLPVLTASAADNPSAPRHRTFAALWWRVMVAVATSWQIAARTFWKRFATIDIPMPVRQTSMPKSAAPVATSFATAIA